MQFIFLTRQTVFPMMPAQVLATTENYLAGGKAEISIIMNPLGLMGRVGLWPFISYYV